MSDLPLPKKRRGAPKGNQNALKYGFYCRKLHDSDVDGLNYIPSFSLLDEIEVMRVFIRRVVELSVDAQDLDLALDTLRALSNATRGIVRLIHTQKMILPPQKERDRKYTSILEKALTQMEEELQNGEATETFVPPQA